MVNVLVSCVVDRGFELDRVKPNTKIGILLFST